MKPRYMAWAEDIDLPAIFQTISSNPEALEVVKQLNETISFGNSALSRTQEEAIATVVAVANQCGYGALTHGGFFRRHSGNSVLASDLLDDYSRADLDPRTRLMLDFAVRLTQEPGSSTAKDLEGLRRAGLGEEEIVSIILITCLFNFMNRLAAGFGVQVPPTYRKAVQSWLRGPAAQVPWLLPEDETQPDEVQSDQVPDEPPGYPLELDVLTVRHEPAPEAHPQQSQQEAAQDSSYGLQSTAEESLLPEDEQDPGDYISSTVQPETGESPPPVVQKDDEQAPSAGELEDIEAEDLQGVQESAEEFESQGPPEATRNLERFIAEYCRVAPGESATARDLYISYLRWCDDNGEHALLQRNLGVQLTQLGYRRRRRSGGRHWWQGIGLKGQNPDELTGYTG